MVDLTDVPMKLKAAIAATEISAAINAYSITVAPFSLRPIFAASA
jgi:hypothetical protein